MHKIAVFGKGGIGKSTFCANLAAIYAGRGLKVLLVGCDPKHDTTVALTEKSPRTVVEAAAFMERRGGADELIARGRLGVDCVEAGGPEPGIGCAGRGISRMIELLDDGGLLKEGRYDVMLFDVLGDVVCGGFAAPLREGLADKICIVASEELMALYAANNIARAVRNYAANGIGLCGLVANLRDPGADEGAVERFARLIGTKVLAFLPREPAVRRAEYLRRTVFEHAPDCALSRRIAGLADELLRADPAAAPVPQPLSDERFHELAREGFVVKDDSPISAPPPIPISEGACHAPRRPVPGRDEPAERAFEQELAGALGRDAGPDGQSAELDAAEQWRNFFCDYEARRNGRTGLESRSAVLTIRHQDLECDYATPDFHSGLVSFFNFPWPRPEPRRDGPDDGGNGKRRGKERDRGRRRNGGGQISTNLQDLDVIHGGGRKLEQALSLAVGAAEGLDAIVVRSTCVPTVIGDDAQKAVAAFRGKTDVPILYANPADNREADVAKTLFDRVKAEPGFLKTRRRPRCVNLVGFPEGPAQRELSGLLKSAGVDVNAAVMPGMTLEQARGYLNAKVQIFYPNAAFEPVYRSVFETLPIESARLDAPYGVEGTRRWLCAAAELAGRGPQARRAFESAFAPLSQRWAEGKAAGSKVAFVVDRTRLKRLTEPAAAWGVPMVRMLREMGFGVEVLLYGEGRGALAGFKTQEELDRLLKREDFQAVYSEYFFDERLVRAGKAQFCLPFFEMGAAGALRTLERLNGVCRWPFYRKYAKYLEAQR